MSWQATSWVIGHSKHKGSALLTLLCIANCANAEGTHARPGMTRLAKDTRMSRRQVVRIIERLEASGELSVRRTEGVENAYAFPFMSESGTGDKMTRVRKLATSDIAVTPTRDIAMSPITKDGQVKKINTPLKFPKRYKPSNEPSYLIAEVKDPLVIDPDGSLREGLKQLYPQFDFDPMYGKWWRSKVQKRGIGRRAGAAATATEYRASVENYLQSCAENSQNGYHSNGNGKLPAVKITTPEDIERMMRPT